MRLGPAKEIGPVGLIVGDDRREAVKLRSSSRMARSRRSLRWAT